MTQAKAMILGCEGTALTDAEVRFFEEHQPWGLILFARNIGSPDEIKALTAQYRSIVGRHDAPVFIDQEGGRVQRIREPITQRYPTGEALGSLYKTDRTAGMQAARMMSRLHAADLLPLGINANCLPVLDVPQPGSHDVIGDRAYGHNPQVVADMGLAAAMGLLDGGVLPVIKHIPGHGRAMVDSHHALPRCDTPRAQLESVDFEPFKQLADMPMAMTAHLVYEALDTNNPATTSKKIISQVIRDFIGFDGLLMTDDLSMKALSGDFPTKTEASFAAGCDIVLHCNGLMAEMAPVAEATPWLSGMRQSRAERTMAFVRSYDESLHDASNVASLRGEFNTLFEAIV